MIVIVLAAVALGLGYLGYEWVFGASRSVSEKLYASLQLFGLEFRPIETVPWPLQIARVLAPLVTAAAALMTIFVLFRRQLTEFRIRRLSGHVVVCGLGPCGLMLAKALRARKHKVVAVEKPEAAGIDECRQAGVPVLTGDARDESLLDRAAVRHARYLVAACGEDGISADVATRVRTLVDRTDRDEPLDCFVHIDDTDLYERLLEVRGGEAVGHRRAGEGMRVQFFNPSENAAPVMLLEDPAFRVDPDDRPAEPHLLVVGVGQMGTRIVLQAARCWRHLRTDRSVPLRVTVVSRRAGSATRLLLSANDWLRDVCEFECATTRPTYKEEIEDMDVTAHEYEAGEFLGSHDGLPVTSAYVCLDRDDRALKAAFVLQRHLARPDHPRVPIVVRTKEGLGLATLVRGGTGGNRSGEPIGYGLLCRGCTPEALFNPRNEVLAQVIHEEWRKEQLRADGTPADAPALRDWGALEEEHRERHRIHADDMGTTLERRGCFIVPTPDRDAELVTFEEQGVRDPIPTILLKAGLFAVKGDKWEVIAKAMHDDYLSSQLEAGKERGSTPALCDWEELSEEYRDSNRAQARHIETKLAAVGCEVVPLTTRAPALVTFTRDEVEKLAEMEHDRWCEEKRAAGRVYGEKRDDAATPPTHPDLVAWKKLPEDRREIDRNAVRGIPSFLNRVGFVVARKDR